MGQDSEAAAEVIGLNMKGYVTTESTSSYAKEMIDNKKVHPSHFRIFNDLYLSSLGMGTYLGGYDKTTDELVTQAVVNSVEGGINVIDTAINYRLQKAERSVGGALAKLASRGIAREKIFVCSKNGYIPGDADRGIDPNRYVQEEILNTGLAQRNEIINGNCTTVPFLDHQLKSSLRNLGLDTIDLLYLHNVAESQKPTLGEDGFYSMLYRCFEFLEEKRALGKIRYYGMATWDCFRVLENSPVFVDIAKVVEVSRRASEKIATESKGFRFVMLPFNLAMQEAMNKGGDSLSFFDRAQEHGIGIFTSVPILQGQLLSHPGVLQLSKDLGVKTRAQAAIQYVRSRGMPLIAPLIGQKTSEHVKENMELVKISP
jgi:aryl-alcohol dehydrogenase-like predicted oxidoreductase